MAFGGPRRSSSTTVLGVPDLAELDLVHVERDDAGGVTQRRPHRRAGVELSVVYDDVPETVEVHAPHPDCRSTDNTRKSSSPS